MEWPWQTKCESPSKMDAHQHQKLGSYVPWEGTLGTRYFNQDPRSSGSLTCLSSGSSIKDLGISFQAFHSEPPPVVANMSSSTRFPSFVVGSPEGTEKLLSSSNNFLGSGSQFPVMNAGNSVRLKSYVDSERASAIPLSYHRADFQTRPLNVYPRQIEAMDFKSDRSSFIRGCPRVFCLDKVGELFVSDNGLLGVFCLCHGLRMSVAKFCEHSGLFVVNPGDAVILENGETVAQWRRLFFKNLGVTIPEDASGWEWGTGAIASGHLERSEFNNSGGSKNRLGFAPQRWNSEVKSPDAFLYKKRPHFPHDESSRWDKVHSDFGKMKQRNSFGSTHCASSGIVNEPLPNDGNEDGTLKSHPVLNSTCSSGRQMKTQVSNSGIDFAKNLSTTGRFSDPIRVFSGNLDDNGYSGSVMYRISDVDSRISSVELRLGQPSEQNRQLHGLSTLGDLQPLTKAEQQHEQNNSVQTGYSKSTLLHKSTQKAQFAASEFCNLSVGEIQPDRRNYIDNPELIMARLGADDLGSSARKYLSRAEENTYSGRKDSSPCSGICNIAGDSKNNNMINEIYSRMYVSEVRDHMEGGKNNAESLDDEIYVMTNSMGVRIKSKRQLRAHDEFGNLISLDNGRTKNSCFYDSNSRGVEGTHPTPSRESGLASFVSISRNEDESALWLRNAKSSFSVSPRINTKNTTPEQFFSNHVDLNNAQYLEDNNGNLETSRGMSVQNSLSFPAQHASVRNINEGVGSSEYCDGGPMFRFTKGQPNNVLGAFQPCSKCGSSDNAENISARTGISGSDYKYQQSSGIHVLSPHCESATNHPTNEEKPIVRGKKSNMKTVGLAGGISDQKELMLVPSRSLKNSCKLLPMVEQKALSNPPIERITRSKSRKLLELHQCDESPSGHNGDILAKQLSNSGLITSISVEKAFSLAYSIKNQVSPPTDRDSNQKLGRAISSEEGFYNTNFRYNDYVAAHADIDGNNIDSFTGIFGDSKSLLDLVLDEGSAVEKCASSDDVAERIERSSNAVSSCYGNDHHSSILNSHKSCLDKKLMGLRKRKHCPIEEEKGDMKKKAPKWKKLGDSFKASCSFKLVSSPCNSHMEQKILSEGAECSGLLQTQYNIEGFKHKPYLLRKYGKPCNRDFMEFVEGDCSKKISISSCAEGKRKRDSKVFNNEGKVQEGNPKQVNGDAADETDGRGRQQKPVVLGNSGIICDTSTDGKSKPVKFASLLQVNERCDSKRKQKQDFENVEPKIGVKHNQGKKEKGKQKLIDLKQSSKDESCAPLVPNSGDKQVIRTQNNSKRKAVFRLTGESTQRKKRKKRPGSGDRREPIHSMKIIDADAFCCVCGSCKKENDNSLLECSSCFIKVHQACYGITNIPKGRWSCRPCRKKLKNIACVLCGYEGGAMTLALRTRNIVKSLLRAWRDREGCRLLDQSQFSDADLPSGMQNSIISGARDSSVLQWVHVVCGLWTPGTRCPNADTMNAFDVSGVSPSARKMVCTICNRPGGSTIKCRVEDCSVHFHPWCAHQKGLLQSETEGIDDENVGFYGRCVLHATNHIYHPETESPRRLEFSCARIEGFKGRERGYSFLMTRNPEIEGKSVVPPELVKKWLLVDGQKLCKKGSTETEYACGDKDSSHSLQEYIRYREMKGWKHLTVYKSCIHGLGLYTCRLIPRGKMVVEYVGEIVGLRVADKRELEYQSGKKLQYKSACYFFRIDKDTIIDATRKGGIARFVNHSCLPNCVAKVIALRNDKKVVFFAERDIKPGEEITYDYNFNHEEEGKKIPCFCRSKNCRRYLN